MKRILSVIVLVGFVLTISGCAEFEPNHTNDGAVIGGLLGATTGAIIGHQSHDAGLGLILGGLLGATTGAIVGSQVPKDVPPPVIYQPAPLVVQQPVIYQNATPSTPPYNLSLEQIVQWSKAGYSDDQIINGIKASHTIYALTQESINYLKSQGINDRVINALQAMPQ